MKYVASSIKGLEFITEKESSGKKICDTKIMYSSKKDLKSAFYSYQLFDHFKFKDLDDLVKKVKKLNIKFKGKFKINCIRTGKHKFSSYDVKCDVGELFENGVDLTNPDFTLVIDIFDDYCFIGKNFVEYKRDYKIRSSPDSFSSVLAYCLLFVGKFTKTKKILDPICRDGIILLEAAENGCKNLYGLNEDIKNAKINAKIKKYNLNLEPAALDWIDTKFDENFFDLILTKLPSVSKRKSEKIVFKVLEEFFYQVSYALKDKGDIVILVQDDKLVKEIIEKKKFKIKEEHSLELFAKFKILRIKKY